MDRDIKKIEKDDYMRERIYDKDIYPDHIKLPAEVESSNQSVANPLVEQAGN